MSGGGLNSGPQVGMQQPGLTSLEPLAMLQAYRAGRTMINPSYSRPEQFLPKPLPDYIPPPPIVQAPITNAWGQGQPAYWMGSNGGESAGPGTDGSPDGAGTAGADGGDGGGGGGGAK